MAICYNCDRKPIYPCSNLTMILCFFHIADLNNPFSLVWKFHSSHCQHSKANLNTNILWKFPSTNPTSMTLILTRDFFRINLCHLQMTSTCITQGRSSEFKLYMEGTQHIAWKQQCAGEPIQKNKSPDLYCLPIKYSQQD